MAGIQKAPIVVERTSGRAVGWIIVLAGILCSASLAVEYAFSQSPGAPSKPVIVSPKHPIDSLGETVSENQGDDQRDLPVVPGVLVYPHPIKESKPKYSKALKKEKFSGLVIVYGVIAPTGQVLDLETSLSDDAEAASCALSAVKEYRFTPPTLDGKPVAIRFKVVIQFTL